MKVRFLHPKTYPHGTGPRRRVGEVVDFPDDKHGRALLKQWSKTGIVEKVVPPKPAPAPKPSKADKAAEGKGDDDKKPE